MKKSASVALISVATGMYFKYWKNMVSSFEDSNPRASNVTFVVFTDQADEAEAFLSAGRRGQVFPTTAVPWPESTMNRYELYGSRSAEIHRMADVIVHLDADMLFRSCLDPEVLEEAVKSGVCFVQHPGYFRPSGLLGRLRLYLRHPNYLRQDVSTRLRGQAPGDWEARKESAAFVPKSSRQSYFCGGVWFAASRVFSSFVAEVACSIDSDRKTGIVARWHDESHLNRIAAERTNRGTLDPAYCYAPGYPNLVGVSSIIEAVEKGPMRER